MGACCSSKPGEQLPAVSEEELSQLRQEGHLPCIAIPSIDQTGENNLQTVYVANYEHGMELTFLFLDEDRPNKCQDCLYDTIRRPLFGRYSDIESIIIVHDEVIFPGTYSGNQEWRTKTPKHGHATIELSKFQKHENGTDFVLWCNTWNHLLGENNTNTTEAINYCQAKPCGSIETKDSIDYVVRKGSRAEVDARFKGLMTSVSTVMTEDTAKKLGKRIF
jgi:hypothetical protein